MSDPMLPPLPAPPDPVYVAQWTGQIRTIVALAGGIGIGGAWLQHITDAQISNDVTAMITVLGLVSYAVAAFYSWKQKRDAATAAHTEKVASAVASANAGMPVVVTVTPPGQPNIATAVSPLEAARAPKAP